MIRFNTQGCNREESGTKARRAFTLIELLVVIAIIGLISSVVLAGLNAARVRAKDSRRIQDIKQVMNAIELYRNDTGVYPVGVADPACANNATCLTSIQSTIVPTYISSIPTDSKYGRTISGYRYARCSGNSDYYSILIPYENPGGDGQCNMRTTSGPTTATCSWMTSGEPTYGWCDDEI